MKEFTVVVFFNKICSSPVPLLTNLRVWKQTKTLRTTRPKSGPASQHNTDHILIVINLCSCTICNL